jgi:predicted nuclease of restriction endonuclease-like (RecB) superfamily
MRKFAILFDGFENLQVPLADLTWYHNQALMDKVNDIDKYLWYANKTFENGWSRDVLVHQIELSLYERQVITDGKVNNFSQTLPSPHSELARDTLKNPYIFDFIEAREKIVEHELKNELLANIVSTILELGTGFAYYGNNYHLSVGGDDFYIDLLFYNTKLRCYVVIELKTGKFIPEYAGKLNFYLSAIDETLKHELDNPTIGILLCKERNKLTAEYALKDIDKPIGVSEYRLSDFVPTELVDTLPSAEDIEKRINSKYEIEGDAE